MNYQTIANQAEALHANAALTIRGIKYRYNKHNYTFDFADGCVQVTGDDGTKLSLNTRKLSIAKQWLREYLAN